MGREIDRGTMRAHLSVWCAFCYRWDSLDEKKRTAAAKEAKRKGWRYTRRYGWACPDHKGEG